MEERYLTVSALTKYIKYKFDHDHHLENVLLEGEISNFKRHSRGHFYFTLKDSGAQISATMFSSYSRNVKFDIKDGMKVFVKGNVSVYEAGGSYQINVFELKSDGVGDLYLAYEELKRQLEKEGYFKPEYKKPLPKYPKTIGVITSSTGAAIRDIINTISRRYPIASIILYPAIVQGDDAKKDIVKQIGRANSDNIVDVLIVGRGGGSIEDLWAFNERIVAEAIFNSRIPIISAVGHEVDFTIADFVADMRAATPTAAAELATPNIDILKKNVSYYVDTLNKRMSSIIKENQLRVSILDQRIEKSSPLVLVNHKKEIVSNLTQRLNMAILNNIDNNKQRLLLINSRLDANNPLLIMNKGYSITMINDEIVTSTKTIKKDDTLTLRMKDGIVKGIVTEVECNE